MGLLLGFSGSVVQLFEGMVARASSKRNGEIIKIIYPWDADWTTEI